MSHTAPACDQGKTIRVMLVDDSAVIRGLFSRALQKHSRIEIVATASDGAMAIAVLKHHEVDVILLDIEMPHKNGLEALPELKQMAPLAHIIMVSSLTVRNAEISLRALALGATDYMTKPTSHGQSQELESFYHELQNKVLSLGEAAHQAATRSAVATAAPQNPVTQTALTSPASYDTGISILPRLVPKALAIASSTGGPQALIKLFTLLNQNILRDIPVFITQHMPPTFTTLLAEHIAKDAKLQCREATDGEAVMKGQIYLAPGNYHMRIKRDGAGCSIHLDQGAQVNFCRPAADPMLESLAEAYSGGVLCLVLTGMGTDGAEGARAVKKHGGAVIIQDKASSVVWGMPGAVAAHNLQDAIQSIEEMATTLRRLLGGMA